MTQFTHVYPVKDFDAKTFCFFFFFFFEIPLGHAENVRI